jgi:mRNA interferase MazF
VNPRQGDVWVARLNPVEGREQGGTRPVIVISNDAFNRMPNRLIITVPLARRDRGLSHQPAITSRLSGLSDVSFARPENVRAIATSRLGDRLGEVSDEELAAIQALVARFLRQRS